MTSPPPAALATVGEIIATFLERGGLSTAFGVISIHNMPILDAIHTQGKMRFVSARGEAGAMSMADAYARVSGGLGVVITSTGTAAGNAAGGMVEALTAGTPILHLTGQIEREYLDLEWGYIHEARSQLDMLKSVSKAAYRVRSPETALGVLKEAVRRRTDLPSGPGQCRDSDRCPGREDSVAFGPSSTATCRATAGQRRTRCSGGTVVQIAPPAALAGRWRTSRE